MNPHPNFCTKVYVSPHGVNHETWMKHESSRQKLAPVHVGLTSHPRFTSHPRSRVGRGMRDEGLRMILDPEKNVNWPSLDGGVKGSNRRVSPQNIKIKNHGTLAPANTKHMAKR